MQETQAFEKDLADILSQVKSYYPALTASQEKRIIKAFHFAKEAHKDQKRFSGEPYFTHPIEATKILLQLKPDAETICACLLHDVIEDTPITAEEIEAHFGKNIRFLCESVEKIAKVRLRGKEREVESLRKLFVAMAKDIRVIFIKLADRIHNLQTLEFVRPEKRIRIAKESLEIYAPVADRLGIYGFKTWIEDLCFKYLYPKDYEHLVAQIQAFKSTRYPFIDMAKKEIIKLLQKEGIPFHKVEGREKSLYSTYEKMKRKNYVHVSEVYDLLAIRIILYHTNDCYRALGLIHAHWKPIPGRFKDYIAVQKPNGYQSLHTTILGIAKSKIPTEIQIRTLKMHLDAEFGPAAHWVYKEKKHSNFDENYIKKTQWFPQDLSELSKIKSSEEFFRSISESLSSGRIHVLTPKGDIKNLPAKATPIDFAYAIHTTVGHTCVGAKVNGVIRPLDYELKGGDMVEIITKPGKGPNPAWLHFVKSRNARNKIQSYLNKEKKKQIPIEQEKKPSPPPKPAPPPKPFFKHHAELQEDFKHFTLVIGGETDLPYHFAKCCHPSPTKKIIAYSPRGYEFIIHEADCKEVAKLDEERLYEADFVQEKVFYLLYQPIKNFTNKYSKIFENLHIFLWSAQFKKLKPQLHLGKFVVHIPSQEAYQEALKKLKRLKHVLFIKESKAPSIKEIQDILQHLKINGNSPKETTKKA